MADRRIRKHESFLSHFASLATEWTGSTTAFVLSVVVILAWIVTGPIFHYSDTWQLVINTGTTIITFLMVFLIQRAQNKDSQAVHLKLNELVAAVRGASNRLINAEHLTEEELKVLHRHYCKLVELAQQDVKAGKQHTVEEAVDRHEDKAHRPHHPTSAA